MSLLGLTCILLYILHRYSYWCGWIKEKSEVQQKEEKIDFDYSIDLISHSQISRRGLPFCMVLIKKSWDFNDKKLEPWAKKEQLVRR